MNCKQITFMIMLVFIGIVLFGVNTGFCARGPRAHGWFAAGSHPQDYDMEANSQSSGYINSSVSAPRGFGTLMKSMIPGDYLGNRIRMSAYVKSAEIDDWAGLWMRVDGSENKVLSFNNMEDRPIKGTTDWKKYEIVLDVSEKSINISYGILLSGKGKVWFDSLQLELVGSDVATSKMDRGARGYGWISLGSHPQDYETEASSEVSGYIKSRVSEPRGFGNLMRTIEAGKYRGKRVRMSAYVKSTEIANWAGLWMRVDGPENEVLSFDNMQNRAVKYTTDWRKYEIVLDVPENSVGISYGIVLSGTGQAWFDSLQFAVVGNDVPTTDMMGSSEIDESPPTEPINWIPIAVGLVVIVVVGLIILIFIRTKRIQHTK